MVLIVYLSTFMKGVPFDRHSDPGIADILLYTGNFEVDYQTLYSATRRR